MSESDIHTEPPLVFIYDRHATRARGILDLRLEGCQNWAASKHWEIAGRWVDLGDDALSDAHRPQFDEMLAVMTEASADRAVACLVHHWDRLTRHGDRAEYQRRIAAAGGHTVTTFAEDDQVAVEAARAAR